MSQKKQIFKLNILKKLLTDENSCVSLMPSTRLLALPPFFLTDMKSGILYLLNSMLKKYDRSLGGIVIGYQNIKVLMDENTGIIPIGASEMEVNISVEFYIFQPKIGSYLEGVVNKKSNNHIGCLVHQYFNATILKPEDVLYEDWICKDFNVDDKIIFKVIDLDFTTLLPYIEGIYDGRLSLDKVESKSSGNCDIDSDSANTVNKSCSYEVSVSKEFLKCTTNSNEISDGDLLDVKKVKNKCKSKVDIVNAGSSLDESRSFTDTEIKKKKEKKEKYSINIVKAPEEKNSNEKDTDLDKSNTESQDDEKKKRKKKKRNKDECNEQESTAEVEDVEKNLENSTLLPSHIQEKLFQVEDEDSNDFVKFNRGKKEKKRKVQNEPLPSFNKTNECLPSEEVEDDILYSTQLEPNLGSKKMRISFCSPIHQNASFEGKALNKSPISSVHVNSQDNTDVSEKKKRQEKRKREKEDDSEESSAPKKLKISKTSLSKKEETKSEQVNGDDKKSILQMMERLCQEQLNRVKEELNMSSSDKEEKKKKEKKKKKREKEKNESVEVSNTVSQLNGDDLKSELETTLSQLFMRELQKVKEQLGLSSNESFKESKKKVKVKKEEKERPKERVMEDSSKMEESVIEEKSEMENLGNEIFKENKKKKVKVKKQEKEEDQKKRVAEESSKVKESLSDKKSDTKTVVDELCRQQLDRMKEELGMSHSGNVKEKKKKKSVTSNEETSREGTHDSLYDKLLNEAKNAVDLEKIAAPILPPPGEVGKKKKDSEFSDASTSSSKQKKSKHSKEKVKDHHKLSTKYKNGSMYDVVATPEKINPDKSLFSDSEQSHPSPVKKKKVVNGVEAESGKSSKVQNMLDEFYKEETKRLKSESDRESSGKVPKKSGTEKTSQNPSGKEESLYEKLLKQAKSLIDVRDVSLPAKKEKKAKKNKKPQDCVKS